MRKCNRVSGIGPDTSRYNCWVRVAAFRRAGTVDRSNLLERFVTALHDRHIPFCLIGGQAVNAYVEPVISLDLDIAVAADRIGDVEALARRDFHVERFTHSLNISDPDRV